jgi:hypothetical protein
MRLMKICGSLLPVLVSAASLYASNRLMAAEQVAAFTAQPDRCIALNRGQMCYQKLIFQWQTAAGSRYCLYQHEVAAPIVCWTGTEKSSHEVEFASDHNIIYRIRHEGQMEILAAVEVELAWVYQSNRKSFSRWRLF